jgi:hypothetical protein
LNRVGLDTVEFVIRLEETFGLRFENAETARVETLADLEVLVQQKLQAEGRFDDHVRHAISRVLIEEFGVPSRLVRPSARIARDLGLD